jgi:hypothetical protein
VFYSDQGAVFTEAAGGDGDDLTGGVSRSQARRKFADFLRCFRGEPSPGRVDGATVYRDCLDADPPPRTLQVVLEDLLAFDAQLADALKKNPRTFVPLVRRACSCPVCLCGCQVAVQGGRRCPGRARGGVQACRAVGVLAASPGSRR